MPAATTNLQIVQVPIDELRPDPKNPVLATGIVAPP
jgi:hypothetical protein